MRIFRTFIRWGLVVVCWGWLGRVAILPVQAAVPVPGNWVKVFSDDFDGTQLDSSKWVTCFPWGNSNGCGSTTTPLMWYLPANVIVQNGVLTLRAKRESYTTGGKTYPYTSGMVTTAGFNGLSSYKRLFTYGYIEARAKMTAGQGLWPAYWTLPPEGAWPPEIDVLEILGDTPQTVHLHYHYLNSSGVHQDSGGSYTGPAFNADFHTFGVYWSPTAIRWFVDGVERRSAFTQTQYIASDPMYLILNHQVGGDWPGDPDNTTPFPADYVIDYVYVWQEQAGPSPTPTPTLTPVVGDTDGDGDIDVVDVQLWDRHYGQADCAWDWIVTPGCWLNLFDYNWLLSRLP